MHPQLISKKDTTRCVSYGVAAVTLYFAAVHSVSAFVPKL
jgi:hypothetical protein